MIISMERLVFIVHLQRTINEISLTNQLFILDTLTMASKSSIDTNEFTKEIKTQVKQARELIDQKKHDAALKLCEVR
jgi:hypothetical protein